MISATTEYFILLDWGIIGGIKFELRKMKEVLLFFETEERKTSFDNVCLRRLMLILYACYVLCLILVLVNETIDMLLSKLGNEWFLLFKLSLGAAREIWKDDEQYQRTINVREIAKRICILTKVEQV